MRLPLHCSVAVAVEAEEAAAVLEIQVQLLAAETNPLFREQLASTIPTAPGRHTRAWCGKDENIRLPASSIHGLFLRQEGILLLDLRPFLKLLLMIRKE